MPERFCKTFPTRGKALDWICGFSPERVEGNRSRVEANAAPFLTDTGEGVEFCIATTAAIVWWDVKASGCEAARKRSGQCKDGWRGSVCLHQGALGGVGSVLLSRTPASAGVLAVSGGERTLSFGIEELPQGTFGKERFDRCLRDVEGGDVVAAVRQSIPVNAA